MLKKNWILICVLMTLIGKISVSDFSNHNISREKPELKGSQQYWLDRIGEFESKEDYISTVNKTKKLLAKIPKKRALGLDWDEIGPDNIGGRSRAILIDNENSNLIFAGGVSGGLWYSTDAGQSWNNTTAGDKEAFLTVTCITQDSEGYIYYGTGEGTFYGVSGTGGLGYRGQGVYRSTTPHGTEFEHLPNTWTSAVDQYFVSVNAMAADNNGNVYAACDRRLYRTQDKGATWQVVGATGLGFLTVTGWDVACTPDGFVIAALGGHVYTSPTGDAGSFTQVSGGTLKSFTGRATVAIAPSDNNYIYVCTTTSQGVLDAFYQSKDKGNTWTKIIGGGAAIFEPFTGGGPQGIYDQCIAVYPNDPTRIVLGGIEIYRWKEGGNWEKLSKWNAGWGDHNYVHADAHTIRFHPTDPNTFYIGTDGGIFRTKDDAEIFERLNRGYNVTQFYGIAYGPDGAVLGGTQDNANIFIDGKGNTALSGDIHNSGDGGWACMSQLYSDALFCESQYGRIRRNNTRSEVYSEFFYHPDANLNLDYIEYDYQWAPFVTSIVLWESKNDELVPDSAAFLADKSYNSGEVVDVASGVSDVTFKHTLTQNVAQGQTIQVKNKVQSVFAYGTYQAMYITREALDFSKSPEWIELTSDGMYAGSPRRAASAIAFSADGDFMYYGTNYGEVYRVSNLSQVVSDATASLAVVTKIGDFEKKGGGSSFITDIAVDQNDPEHVLVSVGFYDQDVNVYASTSAASALDDQSFVSVQGDLPNFPVYSTLIEKYSGAYVIGTEYGTYTSTDGGSSWTQESNGLPNSPVAMIRQQTFPGSSNNGQIYIGTHGRGMFSSTHYVGTEKVENKKSTKASIKIYPNPVIDQLNLELPKAISGKFPVEIFSLEGKLVQSTKETILQGKLSDLSVSKVSSGQYYVVVKTNQETFKGTLLKK